MTNASGWSPQACGNPAHREFGPLRVCHVHEKSIEHAALALLAKRPALQAEVLYGLDWSLPKTRAIVTELLAAHDEERLRAVEKSSEQRVRSQLRRKTKATEENSLIYYVRRSGHIKIGRTTNLPKRLKALAIGGDRRPEVVGMGPVELMHTHAGGPVAEAQLHRKFAASRVAGEWFLANPVLLRHIERLKLRAVAA